MTDLLKKFDKNFNATGKNYGKVGPDRTIDDVMKRRQDRWNFLFIAGMWFQDLFNYDFRRTEQCIIPYATQEARSASAPTTRAWAGATSIEKMHHDLDATKWYEGAWAARRFSRAAESEDGRRGACSLPADEIVTHEVQHDLDKLGIAKTAREEKRGADRSRDEQGQE